MGMSMGSAHSVRVFDLLSSHSPNMAILYIKSKLNITAIYIGFLINFQKFLHQISPRGIKYSDAGKHVSEF